MTNFMKKNISLVIGLIFTFYYLYTFFNALDINSNIVNALLLVIIIYFQTVWEFFYFYKKNGKPRLQDWFRIMIFLMLILNFMSIVNNLNGLESIYFITQQISLNSSDYIMLVLILALVSLDIAYIINNSLKNKILNNSSFSITKKNFIFVLLVATTFFQMYLLVSGVIGFGNNAQGISSTASLIKMISNYLMPFALILSAYILFIENNQQRIYKVIFYSMVVGQVLVGFLSGMKENAILPILYTLIVYFLGGKKIPKNFIFFGIFFMLILYPINNEYRRVISNPYLNTGSSSLNMAIAINRVLKEPLSDILSSGSESYAKRGEMFPFLVYVIDNESKWDYYKNMNRYLYLPIAWIIPRAILADKPRADIGGILYTQITGIKDATAVTATTLGWAYLEGGILYVMLTFLILGFIFEFIDSKNLKNPLVLLFYAILLHFAIKPEWDTYFMINSLISMFVLYWILLKLIGVEQKYEN